MNLDSFVNNFEVIVNSENGVRQVKDLIRTLALKGLFIDNPNNANSITESSLNQLPKSWRWAKIDEVADFVNGFAFRSDEYCSRGVGVVRMSDMKNGEIDPSGMKHVSTDRLKTLDSHFQIRPNDIVMGMTGATLGKPCINKTSETFLLNQRIGKFTPKGIDPNYFFMALENLESFFMSQSFGTGVNNLSTLQIKNTLIPLPPKDIQKKIVTVVKEIHERCDKLESGLKSQKLIADRARKSAIYAFSIAQSPEETQIAWERIQGSWELFVNNPKSISDLRQLIIDIAIKGQLSGKKEKGEQGYPIDWEISDFGKICDIEGGSQPPKTTFVSEPKDGYIQLFQIRDLGTRPVPVYIPIKLAKSTSKEGEILVGRYGASVGKIFRAKHGAYNVALVKFIFPREKLLSEFVYWLLKSSPSQSLFTGMSRSAQAGFNKGDLKPLLIPIPSKEEQVEIIETINAFMVICDQLEKSLIESSQLADNFARSVVSA